MEHTDALRLMLISFGAYFVPLIARRLMLPSSVGEIFFGMAIAAVAGPFMGGFMSDTVKILSQIGFLLLMYIAGMEIDLDRLATLKRKNIFLYITFFAIITISSILIVFAFNLPLFFFLVFMTSAIGLLFSVLKDLDMVKSEFGQTLLLLGAIGEVITFAGIIAVTLISKDGTLLENTINIIMIAVFIGAVFFVMRLLRLFLWWYPETKGLFMAVNTPNETGVRANLFNMFAFVALALFLGLEDILGAFLGGLIFARLFAEREDMLEKLSGFGYGFLIPLFFIEVGTRFKLSDFMDHTVLMGALLISLCIFLIRIPATAVLIFTKLPKKQLVLVPASLSFPLTLLVAAATLGESTGMIEHKHTSAIILSAVVSAIFFPWIMKLAAKYIKAEEGV